MTKRIRATQWAKANRSLWEDLHHTTDLEFTACEIRDVKGLDTSDRYMVHKSPTWYGRQSSAYYVMRHEGNWVYARVSNHWGRFHTNATCEESGCGGWESDRCEGGHYKSHNWELNGGKRRKDGGYVNTSQAGYIVIAQGAGPII